MDVELNTNLTHVLLFVVCLLLQVQHNIPCSNTRPNTSITPDGNYKAKRHQNVHGLDVSKHMTTVSAGFGSGCTYGQGPRAKFCLARSAGSFLAKTRQSGEFGCVSAHSISPKNSLAVVICHPFFPLFLLKNALFTTGVPTAKPLKCSLKGSHKPEVGLSIEMMLD
jgi:hypothetical protein